MAKKVRRARKAKRTKNKSGTVTERSPADGDSSVEYGDRQITRSSASNRKNKNKLTPEEELREEYAYVILDLRRIAILAAAMFVLLILLNVLLQ